MDKHSWHSWCGKITKRDFEQQLMRDFAGKITASRWDSKTTLYYLDTPEARKDNFDCPLHVASWGNGKGCTFKHADKFKTEHSNV